MENLTYNIINLLTLSEGLLKWNKTLNMKCIYIFKNKYNRYIYLVKDSNRYFLAYYSKKGFVEMDESFVSGFPSEKDIIQALIKNLHERIISLDDRKSQLLRGINKLIVSTL